MPDRSTPGRPGGSSRQGINSQVEKEFGGKGPADDLRDFRPIPAAEVRALLAERTAHHAAGGLVDDAIRYMAARDVFETLKADPRLASVQMTPGRCNVCGGRSGEGFLRVGAGGVLVHPACLGEHRRMVAERVDDLVVSALRAV